MGAAAVNLVVSIGSTIQEVLDPDAVPGASSADLRTLTHDNWRVERTLTSTTTPDPVRCLVLEIEIPAPGIYELDLEAAPTSAAPTAGEDLTGMRVIHAEFQTPSTNVAAIVVCDQDASNMYDLLGAGNELSVPKNTKIGLLHESSLLPAVGSSDKIIRFSGTEDDIIRVKLTFE